MDQKVFDELMNRGIVTNVGLAAENYTDVADLQNKGLATAIGAVEEYNDIVNGDSTEEPTDNDIVVDEGNDDVTPCGTIETPTEEEGEL